MPIASLNYQLSLCYRYSGAKQWLPHFRRSSRSRTRQTLEIITKHESRPLFALEDLVSALNLALTTLILVVYLHLGHDQCQQLAQLYEVLNQYDLHCYNYFLVQLCRPVHVGGHSYKILLPPWLHVSLRQEPITHYKASTAYFSPSVPP